MEKQIGDLAGALNEQEPSLSAHSSRSTFYCDGYRDAIKGRVQSPPDISVYAAEYMDGYQDGYYSIEIEVDRDPPFNFNLVR